MLNVVVSCVSKMASAKRKKTSLTVSNVVLKKIKLSSVVLNPKTFETVLCKLVGEDFDYFMLDCGPEKWKELTNSMTCEEAKKLMLILLCRGELLVPFAAYITLLQNDAVPAQHLYDLHLGGALKQNNIPSNAKNIYLTTIAKEGRCTNVFAFLPTLKHNKHYFCLNKNLVKDTDEATRASRRKELIYSRNELFYYKLCSALTTAKLQRWSECFAHSLSALDNYQEGFDHVHEVLCFIAYSGSYMSVPPIWCCSVLEEASLHATSMEHIWRRLIVFQTILLNNGMFTLEKEVFNAAQHTFIQSTAFFQQFVGQHLQGKMARIENIMAHLHTRQKYHEDCDDTCKRQPCFDYTWAEVEFCLNSIDAWASKLQAKGVTDYFRAYMYLYTSILHLNQLGSTFKAINCLNIATNLFELAKLNMKTSEFYYWDMTMMHNFLNRRYFTLGYIEKTLAEKEYSKYSVMARNFLFRAMVVTMYWENKFQPFPLVMLITKARDMDAKGSNGYSYRGPLLTAILKGQDATFYHCHSNGPDFPIVRVIDDVDMRLHWTKERANVCTVSKFTPIKGPIQRVPPSAEAILSKCKLAEQVYAFGYQITEDWTILD